MQTNHSPSSQQATTSAPIQQTLVVDASKHVVVIAICAAFCALSASVAVWAVMRFGEMEKHYADEAEKTGTEYRVLLNHYMELQAEVKEMRRGK